MYKYRHDAAKRTVYKFPITPHANEIKDKKGRRTDWSVNMDIIITRADNKLTGSQWKHRVFDPVTQHLDPKYTKDDAISYFLMHHAPEGEDISESEYQSLHSQYEAMARKN